MTMPRVATSTQFSSLPLRPCISNRAKPVDAGKRKSLMMRKYQVTSLRANGQIDFSEQIGPATPRFESAFSAFARGTLISTTDGQVAIEDLVPGMSVKTQNGGSSQLLWVGSMTLVPNAKGLAPEDTKLTRVMADCFGVNRPSFDLMTGPGARLLIRPLCGGEEIGEERVLTPARNLADGMNTIEISPPRAVTVYHICLQEHSIIKAAGMEAESFHPGNGFEQEMGQNMLTLFLSLFPHIDDPTDFGDIAFPRLPFTSKQEMELA